VRGGHGLFAVIELVADRATRARPRPGRRRRRRCEPWSTRRWPRACAFATRGNLILLAPRW
jgi:taurine--2-oxoglutarate transaminase